MTNERLVELRQELDGDEERRLSPLATLSRQSLRQHPEKRVELGHRQWFAVDADRILHSLAYTRYIDKTQVFSLIPNDHLTHRVLHVQLVSKVARTIARFLRLNEDLVEAIALGHDLGHPPFGHDGERYLSALCREAGLPHFLHSVQGVRFLRHIERKGEGCNLSLQVLDGILCHDGELHQQRLAPDREKDFSSLDREMRLKERDPGAPIRPMTLEGCVVRMSDTISYIGRDMEDAVRLGLVRRDDLPESCKRRLGSTNGTIVYNLVEDLILNSIEKDEVSFSPEVAQELEKLRKFNMERIYSNPRIKTEAGKIQNFYRLLFETLLEDLEKGRKESVIFSGFLDGMAPGYLAATPKAGVVRDFIAGMTDAYFLRLANQLFMPQQLPARFT